MRTLIFHAVVLATVAVLTGCTFKPAGPALVDDGPTDKLFRSPTALDFTLPRHPGAAFFKLSSERGKVVLLDVWATWCEPCREALPLYQDLATEFGPRGLSVITLNVDEEPSAIAPFLKEAKVSLPVLLDPNAQFAQSTLKVKVMPTAFLIDKKGLVRFVHEGFDEAQLPTWLSEIDSLLGEFQ